MKHGALIRFLTIVSVGTVVLPGVTPTTASAEGATARWSWQEPQAKVLPTGDLEWAPQPFEFKPGASVRYIDFDSGRDDNDGLSKQTPWKHHPWDPDAAGQARACKGAHTYVFKQGVVYRGELNANESGTADSPILLTPDPSWGTGPAVICGSEAVTGWKKGADNDLIPEPEKVWHADLDWAPRNVWMVGRDGAVTRIALARTPNWTITDRDDIKSEWWTWKNPDKPFDNYATVNGQRRHVAFDKEHINESYPPEYYEGAIVWTTKGWVMGSPFPARVLAVDREQGSLTFPGQWGGGPSYKIIRGCRYYLEDKPQYLDSPGEFWFDKKGSGGRLYLRLPEDRNPNMARVEVARRIRMIDSRGMSHVQVRGLTFRFTNTYWNLTAAPYWVSHESIDVEPGCVRLLGSGTDIQVSHCTFEHVHKGVRLKAMGRQDVIDQVVVEDCVFSHADSGGVELADGTTYGDVDLPTGRLYDVRVLRNKFDHIGIRPDLFGQGETLEVDYARTAEVAGNLFERVCAQGIDVHGAKPSGAATDRPFTRILIHHNKVVDSLLNVDDFGGIETWQGGPAYVYDNISGNPGGYRNWDHVLSPDTEDRFGHAYYLDGAFKNYHFNNIAWGKSKGPAGKLANTSAFQEIISYQNTFFNNTIYNFVRGSRRQEPQAGRVKFLGNIWQSMGLRVFRDADPARTAAGNEAANSGRGQYAIDTDAYTRNVFYDVGESFGVFEPSGRWHQTLQAFREALENYKPLAATVGVMADQSPLCDPAAHDFRPSADSAARGQGAKVFVPWSLYETVGEWNFYPIPGDPTRILDEHWCMSPYYTGRDNYHTLPTYPLRGVNIALNDYQGGPLENWTTGALHFNGRDQYAVLANEDINRTVTMGGQRGTPPRTVSGTDLSNPQIHTSNFLIEVYFQTTPGQKDGTVVHKMDNAGYALRISEAGSVTLTAKSGRATASLASRSTVNDGRWHHVIAEADRRAGTFTIYIDGRQDARGPGLGADASLANDADLYVGGTPRGHNLEGAVDFLRLARGTLADSQTTIEELYAWEFHGPFLYDFAGRERPAAGGYAGALDEGTPEPAPAATYVVDQAAPGAADDNPGTEDKPFKTVQHAADVAGPGDTICVMAGRYDERVTVKTGGMEGRPIAFVARPRRSATVGGFDLGASYIRVEGFEITADRPATAVQLRASYCEVVDNYIHDMMTAVSGTVGKPSADGNTRDYSAVAHNRIAYNKVYHCEYGFILGGEDWLVENNEVNRLFMYAPGNRNDDCDYSRFFGKGCIQRYNYYHGSTRSEIKTAHVDCLQTFTNNGEIAQDLVFEYNTCFDFHQMCMVESAPHIGSVRGWTFRHNIVSPNAPTMRGGWGPDIIQTLGVTIENCTISTVAWAAIGLRGKESTGGLIRNNILCEAQRAVDDRMDFTPANPVIEYNLTFKTAPLAGGTNVNGRDPCFADPQKRDFRLRPGSPAIGMGSGGVTVGALEYPNVYYVDPRHPAASDEPAWGYPAVPLASLTRACAIAQPGETIVLRGGVYREVLAPKNDGVTIRAMKGEKVVISGADLIEGWQREGDGSWSAPLAAAPKEVLRDGRPWRESRYDQTTRRIIVKTGGDPRLHVFETVLRQQGIDLAGRKGTKVEEITVLSSPTVSTGPTAPGTESTPIGVSLSAPDDGGTPRDAGRIVAMGQGEFRVRACAEEGHSVLTHAASRVDLLCRNDGVKAQDVVLHLDLSDDGRRTNADDSPFGGMPTRDFIFIQPAGRPWRQIDGSVSGWVCTVRFPAPPGETRVGLSPWYTYGDYLRFVRSLPDHPCLQKTRFGISDGGREHWELAITDPGVPPESKRTIFWHAREHAYETFSSYAMEGLVAYLLSDAAADARRRYQFVLHPMTNVDGVAQGYEYRSGYDYPQPRGTATGKLTFAAIDRLRPDFAVTWHNWVAPRDVDCLFYTDSENGRASRRAWDLFMDRFPSPRGVGHRWENETNPLAKNWFGRTLREGNLHEYAMKRYGTQVWGWEMPWWGRTDGDPTPAARRAGADFGRAFVATLNLVAAGRASAAPEAPPVTVARWRMHEFELHGRRHVENPFRDAALVGEFTSPSGKTKVIEGFYDGGDTWRLRFTPDEEGEWSYLLRGEGVELHRRGRLRCASAQGHGFIRVHPDNSYAFAHADGTPFFPMGDTCYGLYSDSPITPALRTQYLQTRRSQRFDFVRLGVLHSPTHGQTDPDYRPWAGTPEKPDLDRLNPAFFRGLDAVLTEMQAAGMNAELIVLNYYLRPFTDVKAWTPQRQQQWLRYVTARYAAFPNLFLWTIANEYETHPDGRYRLEVPDDPDWAKATARFIKRHDPYRHLVTVHPVISASTRGRTPNDPFDPPWRIGEFFGTDDAMDVLSQQTGQFGAGVVWDERLQCWTGDAPDLVASLRADRRYGRPVLNTESGYEYLRGQPTEKKQVHHTDKVRHSAWRIVCAGGYFAAGFNGTIGHSDFWNRIDAPNHYTFAVKDEGAAGQLAFLYDFFAALPFWRMQPFDGVTPDSAVALAEPGQIYVIYLPQGGGTTVDLDAAKNPVTARWFNPREGTWAESFQVAGGRRVAFQAPDDFDWVLYLSAPAK